MRQILRYFVSLVLQSIESISHNYFPANLSSDLPRKHVEMYNDCLQRWFTISHNAVHILHCTWHTNFKNNYNLTYYDSDILVKVN